MTEPTDIDLAYDPLRLWECGRCKALTMRENAQAHIDWHAKAGI